MNDIIYQIYKKSPFLIWVYKKSFLSYFFKGFNNIRSFIVYKTLALFQYIVSLPRQYGIKDNRFKKLLSYKDKYYGKRCFVACTGPSLTIADLELLNNEYVFGMNSICMIHNQTDWIPDFLGFQDASVFDKIKYDLLSANNGLVFAPYSFKKRVGNRQDWVYFHMCDYYHYYEANRCRNFVYFSDNPYIRVYDGYTITYSILQLAFYMGFKEIYLIGADCNYLGEKRHFIEHGIPGTPIERVKPRLTMAYTKAKMYADRHDIKIVNVTRGGCLEVFPRETLESVLSRIEKNKIR
ncbi:MAG: DUF115 domain-containing protein [Bacteroidales bacterium]|nr:DUF115 domain-containing protein [Bacteroidales bacterium]